MPRTVHKLLGEKERNIYNSKGNTKQGQAAQGGSKR